jgi:hypothetical protein
MKKIVFLYFVLTSAFALDMQSVTPNGQGGYDIYDYNNHSFKSITKNGNGYDYYDYGNNEMGSITPNGSGGYDIFTY